MSPRRLSLFASLVASSACAPPPLDEPLAYPAPQLAASCITSPSLCGLALHDLGGGDHANAFHVVLVGDGYLDDEQGLFAWEANSLAFFMQNPDGALAARNDLVTRAPALFHFWRVDVPSDSIEVDDDVLTNTPLGAHLGAPDNCVGSPLIRAIEDRFALALDQAELVAADDDERDARRRYGSDDAGGGDLRAHEVNRWPGEPVTSSRATFVLLSHRSSGRANATPGGNVRMSSFDGTDTMAHELGHALFHLADEYTELSTCEPSPLPITCGPPPDISEVALLERANTSTLHDGSKWSFDVDGSEQGGNRWPCHAHPTDECLMLGSDAPLCAACASAVEERFARRRCEDDTRPPRVAIERDPAIFAGGTRALVAASAFDERALSGDSLELAWTLDGEPLRDERGANVTGPFAVVDLSTLAGRALRATANDGSFVHASSPVALPSSVVNQEEADVFEPELLPLEAAGLSATLVDDTGTVLQLVRGVHGRFAVAVRPRECTTVVRAGVAVGRKGAEPKVMEIALPAPTRVRCGGSSHRALFIALEPDGDPGEALEVRGFVVDAKGRSAETDAWHPVVLDREACDLTIDVSHARQGLHGVHEGTPLGAFDPIVVDAPSNAQQVDVRAGHTRVDALPRGPRPSSGYVVMPVAFPTPTGAALDVDLRALCWLDPNDDSDDSDDSDDGDEAVTEAILAVSSTRVAVRWDNEAPAIAAQTALAPFADHWDVVVLDDSTIDSVTIAAAPLPERAAPDGSIIEAPPPSDPLVLAGPPWRVSPAPHGPLVISATDIAGNKSTRVVDVVRQTPLDRDVVCPGGAL